MRLMGRAFASILFIVILLSAATFLFNVWSISKSNETVGKFISKITIYNENQENTSGYSLVTMGLKIKDEISSNFQSLQRNNLWALLGSVLFSLILVGSVFLLISHRIAGPIYRMEKTLQGIQDGDLTMRVVLRDKDELTDLAEQFNQMTASLNQKVNLIQQTIIQLQIDVEKESIDSELRKRLIEKIGTLESLVKQFKVTYN